MLSWLYALEDIAFPPVCAGCGHRGDWLCTQCAASLRPLGPNTCPRCGEPLAIARDGCPNCSSWPEEIGVAWAAFVFEGPLRESIHRFKYTGEFARGAYLAGLLGAFAQSVPALNSGIDMVCSIPLHRSRRRVRGFDQAEILARGVAEALGVRQGHELARVVATKSQVGQGAEARRRNVQGAFRWQGGPLDGARVLLVDDVFTTGSTFVAASGALIAAGAGRVDGLALAREL